jgi:hypothetical protein
VSAGICQGIRSHAEFTSALALAKAGMKVESPVISVHLHVLRAQGMFKCCYLPQKCRLEEFWSVLSMSSSTRGKRHFANSSMPAALGCSASGMSSGCICATSSVILVSHAGEFYLRDHTSKVSKTHDTASHWTYSISNCMQEVHGA